MEQKTINRSFQGCSYDFTNNINTCEGLEFTGEKPDNGTLSIDSDGDISMAVKIDKLCYYKGYSSDKIISKNYNEETCKISFNGNYIEPSSTDTHKGIVYLDPTNLLNKCDETNSTSIPGTKTGCMKFYIFKENEDGTVDMILDHNTSLGIIWSLYQENGEYVNYKGPREALYQLYEDTKDWDNKLSLTPSSNYTATWTYDGIEHSYTIDYTKHLTRTGLEDVYEYTLVDGPHKARFITAEEVAEIVGNNDWTIKDEYPSYLFGSLRPDEIIDLTEEEMSRQRKYSWLVENLYRCDYYGCSNYSTVYDGNMLYFTSSPAGEGSNLIWTVNTYGGVYQSFTYKSSLRGVRPVITVSRDILGI
ncbi:MAG: hypothetical protein ACI31V_01380 [Bacilli bacterium]